MSENELLKTLKNALENLLDVYLRQEAGYQTEIEVRFLVADEAKAALKDYEETLGG